MIRTNKKDGFSLARFFFVRGDLRAAVSGGGWAHSHWALLHLRRLSRGGGCQPRGERGPGGLRGLGEIRLGEVWDLVGGV